MATRSGYTALTLELTSFPPGGGVTFIPAPEPSSPASSFEICQRKYLSRWHSAVSAALRVVKANTGLLLVAASQFFFSLMNVSVKKLNSLDAPVPTLELVIVRMGITYICCMIYMYWKNVPDTFLGPKGVRLWLAFRGFSGFFGLFGVYYSLEYLSLSDATVLTFLAPIFTGIIGALFMKEAFSRNEALAGLCSFFGVVLIARPHFLFGLGAQVPIAADASEGIAQGDPSEKGTADERLIAVGVALIGVAGATGAYTSLRAIGRRAHPLHSLTSFSLQSVTVATIGMLVFREKVIVPTRIEWLAMLLMIGVFGFIAQTLLAMGLQRETAGRGTMAVYIQIIFALALERIFFHVTPSPLSITGTVIILSSAIYIALTKENATPQKPTQISLEYPGEAALEEGLLSHDESRPMDVLKELPSDAKEEDNVVTED